MQAALRVQERYPGRAHFVLVLRSDGEPEIEERKREFRKQALALGIPVYDEMMNAGWALSALCAHERFLAARPVVERAANAGDYARAFEALAGLRASIDAYFNDVLVMAEDEAVRANRLAFLAQVAGTIALIADFRKLVKR